MKTEFKPNKYSFISAKEYTLDDHPVGAYMESTFDEDFQIDTYYTEKGEVEKVIKSPRLKVTSITLG